MDRIVCLSSPTKCLGVDTSLVGDVGLFATVDGPASSWNRLHGSVSCSPCLRAYVAGYLPPVGSYGFHSSGGGGGGGGSAGKGASPMGLSRSGSSGMAGVGSWYNSIKKCSCLCLWLQRRGERARCNREGGLSGLGRGRGRGSGGGGGDSDWVGDKGCTTSGAWGWDSCGKADGKMMAWLLVSSAGVVDRVGPNDEEDGKKGDKEERDLSHALLRLMAALALSVACNLTL